MATSALERLKEAIEHLSPEEQQELMAHLKRQISGARPRRKWAEIAGKAPIRWLAKTLRSGSHTPGVRHPTGATGITPASRGKAPMDGSHSPQRQMRA